MRITKPGKPNAVKAFPYGRPISCGQCSGEFELEPGDTFINAPVQGLSSGVDPMGVFLAPTISRILVECPGCGHLCKLEEKS